MKGFMRQRGSSWELRVYLSRDPVTGKKRYATRTVRGGKREAQSALAEMITEAERGLTVRPTATCGGRRSSRLNSIQRTRCRDRSGSGSGST